MTTHNQASERLAAIIKGRAYLEPDNTDAVLVSASDVRWLLAEHERMETVIDAARRDRAERGAISGAYLDQALAELDQHQ